MPSNQTSATVCQFIDELDDAHDIEKQLIADAFHDGLVLLTLGLNPLLINQKAQQYFSNTSHSEDIFKHIKIYSQKRHKTVFDLKQWLMKNRLKPGSETTPLLWIKTPIPSTPNSPSLTPVLITVHKIASNENKTQKLLISFQDQSLKIQAKAQLKLIEANYSAQFITDQHGYITLPNHTFCAYTGLTPEVLANTTYIEWLKKQAVFKVPFN